LVLPAADERLLRLDQFLDLLVTEAQRLEHRRLGDLLRAALDHHQRVVRARDDDVQVRGLDVAVRAVRDQLAVDARHAHRRDRRRERHVRQHHGRRCADEREHVRLELRIRRQHLRRDLRLVAVAVGEERAQRAIDEAGGQDLLLRHAAFALKKPPGSSGRADLRGSRRSGEEVDALARLRSSP
jgi:hypothetical protein